MPLFIPSLKSYQPSILIIYLVPPYSRRGAAANLVDQLGGVAWGRSLQWLLLTRGANSKGRERLIFPLPNYLYESGFQE